MIKAALPECADKFYPDRHHKKESNERDELQEGPIPGAVADSQHDDLVVHRDEGLSRCFTGFFEQQGETEGRQDENNDYDQEKDKYGKGGHRKWGFG